MKKIGGALIMRELRIGERIYGRRLRWRPVLEAKTESEPQRLFLNLFHTALSLFPLGRLNEVNLSRRHFPEASYNGPIG
jgi:hypothetical protein